MPAVFLGKETIRPSDDDQIGADRLLGDRTRSGEWERAGGIEQRWAKGRLPTPRRLDTMQP